MSLGAALLVVAVGTTVLAIRLAGDDGAALASWTTAARDAGTYRFSMSQEISGQKTTQMPGFGVKGAVDMAKGLSRMESTFKMLGISAKCIYIGDETMLYVNVHSSRRAQLKADWLRSDTKGIIAGASLPFRPDQLDDDPERVFKDLKQDGEEEIRGVQTTRYTGTFDVASFYPRSSPAPLPSALGEPIPVAVYISDDDLVRRMTMQFAGSSRINVAFTIDLFDYGKPVDIKLPPPNVVKDGRPEEIGTACFPASIGASIRESIRESRDLTRAAI